MHEELIDEPKIHQDGTPPGEVVESSKAADPHDPFPVSGEPQETDHNRWRDRKSTIEVVD